MVRWSGARLLVVGAVMASASFLFGCAQSAVRPSVHSAQQEAGFSPDQQALVDDNCPFGIPVVRPDAGLGPTRYAVRDGYVLEHSSLNKFAYWVCEHLTSDELASTSGVTRRNVFAADPQLDGHPRAELGDYRGSGYDRGHLAPAGNQASSQRLKDETFFLSNMVPQVGPGFNQSIWRVLEDVVAEWGRTRGDLWVITGGFFYEEEEDDPATADGIVEMFVIGNGEVAVPTHLYKIAIGQDPSSGNWEAIAFVMENTDYPRQSDEDYDFTPFIRSIDWIEQRTGIDFMPDLAGTFPEDPGLEQRLEAAVPGSVWTQ